MLIGVDEAGRGPVLGSMFVAAVGVPDGADLPAGIVDSKQLSAERREALAATLREDPAVRTAVIEVSPNEIDAGDADLNRLTARAHADAIRKLLPGDGTAVECTVDACDVDAERFRARVGGRLPDEVGLVARHRADEDDRVVAAASILAKSSREAHVADLATRYGEVGSGYPSDPTTRAFLQGYVERTGELPSCARRSWQTSADALAAAEQGTLADFGD